jgi:hypothetical protein
MPHRLLCVALAVAACSSKKATPDAPPPPKPEEPLRDATGDAEVRILVADLLSGRACEQALHHFGGIKDKKRKTVITGEVWVRDCKIANEGANVTVSLAGNGWQWADQDQKKAGGTFGVHQYVKFELTAKLTGTIDVAYDPPTHIASLWFTPKGEPEVVFKPLGEIEVDRESTWASIVGGAGALIGKSPEDSAETAAKKEGKGAIEHAAASGFEISVDLCKNAMRMSKKRLPKGQMPKPSVGETEKIEVEVQNYGVMIYGPYDAHEGMTIDAEVTGGSAKVNLACISDAETTAQAFLDEKANTAKPIKSELVTGKAVLKLPKERCPIAVVIRSTQPTPVQVSFVRPAEEARAAKGGPLASCAK